MREKGSSKERCIVWFVALVLIGISVALLILHTRHYISFFADDALISLRYAKRFISGEGLNWTEGKPVEGYSNLLWILLLSLLGILGLDLIVAARCLGVFCISILIISLVYVSLFSSKRKSFVSLPAALALIVTSAPIAVWASGGLEQPLVAALLGLSIVFCYEILERRTNSSSVTWAASACLGLLCVTRPDSPIFVCMAFLVISVAKGLNRQHLLDSSKLLVFPIVLVSVQMVFRLAYYGEWVPNTALVKISPSFNHIRSGFIYVRAGFMALGPFSFLAVLLMICALIPKTTRAKAALLICPTATWILYLVFIGGDIFPAWRHFVPLIVLFAFSLALGIDSIWLLLNRSINKKSLRKFRLPGSERRRHITAMYIVEFLILVALVPLLFSYVDNQRRDTRIKGQGHIRGAIIERWAWDCKAMALTLKSAFEDKRPLIAVTTAGCLPYWSEFPALDMLGLNDYHIARNRPDHFGKRWIGHELGDGQYVLKRRPDLVSFGLTKIRAKWLSGRQMQRDKRFYEQYKLFKYRSISPRQVHGRMWVRQYSEKIGIKQTDDSVTIPGYLFTGNEKISAYINPHGKFVIPVTSKQPASIVINALSQGDWRHDITKYGNGDLILQINEIANMSTEIVLEARGSDMAEVHEVRLYRY
ncbi:MAG: hypothetical protein GY854_08685 [Deltaproteobacteria bacterium]|nr:hypothetical protein [Deltaproteobacteria bacterium]